MMTRYIVRRVHIDVHAFTKTIGVLSWRLVGDEAGRSNGKSDELDRLSKICTNPTCDADNSNSSLMINGSMHLQGQWYDSLCHLVSLGGTYAIQPSALPVT